MNQDFICHDHPWHSINLLHHIHCEAFAVSTFVSGTFPGTTLIVLVSLKVNEPSNKMQCTCRVVKTYTGCESENERWSFGSLNKFYEINACASRCYFQRNN